MCPILYVPCIQYSNFTLCWSHSCDCTCTCTCTCIYTPSVCTRLWLQDTPICSVIEWVVTAKDLLTIKWDVLGQLSLEGERLVDPRVHYHSPPSTLIFAVLLAICLLREIYQLINTCIVIIWWVICYHTTNSTKPRLRSKSSGLN